MRDHQDLVLRALESMTRRYPHFYEEEVVSRLKTGRSLPGGESMRVAALVDMVDQCLDRYGEGVEKLLNGEVSDPESIDAVMALRSLGLMNVYSVGSASANRSDSSDDGVAYGDTVLLRSDGDDGSVATLTELGLVNVRLADWTEAGKRYLANNMQEWDAWEQQVAKRADDKRKFAERFINSTDALAFFGAVVVIGLIYLLFVRLKFD